MLDQGSEDVGDGQDTNDIGDAFGTERVGISAAIKVFMVMTDGIEISGKCPPFP